MKTIMLLLNKRNAVFSFFKIKIHILSYLIVIAFLLVITVAHAMRKTAESKISLSSGKNKALSVFAVGSGGNYNTLKTVINAGTITGVITVQIISNTIATALTGSDLSLGKAVVNFSACASAGNGNNANII